MHTLAIVTAMLFLRSTQSQVQMCAPGKYATSQSTSVCTPCAAGKFSYNAGSLECQACPDNTGSVSGLSLCVACSSDASCRTASSAACPSCTGSCTACVAGKYNYGGTPKCTGCGAGTYSTAVRAVSSTVCLGCEDGYYTYPTDSGLTACASCVALNQAPPIDANNGPACRWKCFDGRITVRVSDAGFKNTDPRYTAAQALEIYHIQNDYCCNPLLITAPGTYLSGCSRTSNGVAMQCAPVKNGYYVLSAESKLDRCGDWACNDNAYSDGTACVLQPTCPDNHTYKRDVDGKLVVVPKQPLVCVPCSRCIDGSQVLVPCNTTHDTQCIKCSATTFSLGDSGCVPSPPLGYIGVLVRLTSVPAFQGRPSFYADGAPLDWGILSSATGTVGFYLNTWTPCQAIAPHLSYSGQDVPCRRLDTSASACAYPACNTQCRPWNGTAGWFRLGTGQCTPCVYDAACGPAQYSDMSVCGPDSAPRCADCPGLPPSNALTWVNPGRILSGYPPCDVRCRDGFVKTANYTCVPCPNLPNNSKIVSGCSWVCSLGFLQVGQACLPCSSVPTSCGVGTYLGYGEGSQCSRCLPCTNAVANAVFTTAGQDNGPDTCGVRCNPNTFIDPIYGLDVFNNPIVCTPCSSPRCEAGRTYGVACSLSADAYCAPCSACPPGRYAQRPCNVGADVVCAGCDPDLLPANASWSVGCDQWRCDGGFYYSDGDCARCLRPSDCSNSDSFSYVLPNCGVCAPCDPSVLLPGQCFNGDGQCGVTYWCGFTTAAASFSSSAAPRTTTTTRVPTTAAATTTPKPNVTYAAVMTLTLPLNASIEDLIKSIACPAGQKCSFKLVSVKQCPGCRRRLLQTGVEVQLVILSSEPLQSSPVVGAAVQSVAITASHPVSDAALLSNPVQLGAYVMVMEEARRTDDDTPWVVIWVIAGLVFVVFVLVIVALVTAPRDTPIPITQTGSQFDWKGVRIFA